MINVPGGIVEKSPSSDNQAQCPNVTEDLGPFKHVSFWRCLYYISISFWPYGSSNGRCEPFPYKLHW